jgi:hypothetical protein
MENTPLAVIVAGTTVVVAAFLAVAILFLLNLRDLLRACAPGNRMMEPNQVWYWLIPLFGVYWQFVVVNKVAESIDKELGSRGTGQGLSNGKRVGMAMAILLSLGIIPTVGGVFSIPGLVCWIIYWVQTSKTKKALVASPGMVLGEGRPVAG